MATLRQPCGLDDFVSSDKRIGMEAKTSARTLNSQEERFDSECDRKRWRTFSSIIRSYSVLCWDTSHDGKSCGGREAFNDRET